VKAGLWVLTGGLILIWTAGMALLAQILPWLLAQAPQLAGAVEPVLSWPWPQWLGPWVDPVLLQTLQAFTRSVLDWLQPFLPSLQGLGSLLSGLVWLVWAVGLAAALALAVLAHLMLRRRERRALS
jgi:hypothetical protein